MFRFYIRIFFVLLIFSDYHADAQYSAPFYLKTTEAGERLKMHERIIDNVIRKNLALPLNGETESNWQGAFNAMEVVGFQNPFTWQKMQEAMTALPFQSVTFQRHVLEAAYAIYPGDFNQEAAALMYNTDDAKIFAMCAVYLLKSDTSWNSKIKASLSKTFVDTAATGPILFSLLQYMNEPYVAPSGTILRSLFSKDFLKGETILFSIQKRNRDYPGMVLIRRKDGNFLKTDGEYVHIPQLARGIANLPYFLTKGNTPQGIYRMFGFGVSVNQFIGPTANIQMGMPVELKKEKFFDNKTATGEWTISGYQAFLPPVLRDYKPLLETYYAGLAGRNEIIAHGTTIDPEYYRGKPYYPMTPTEGCLCTKEFWDGKLIYSDQQKLVNALLAAGGAYGYVVLFELDDTPGPVTIKDVEQYLQ